MARLRRPARRGMVRLAATAVLLATGLGSMGPGPEDASATMHPALNTPRSIETTLGSYLTGISCSAPASCRAVGYHNGPLGKTVTLAESWDGHRWALEPTRNPVGAIISYLTAVSCGAANACMAVGYYQRIPGHTVSLAEWWNGSDWLVRVPPEPQGATASYLTGVSCTTGDSCMAVGYQYRRSGESLALAETWTGGRWILRSVPRPPHSPDSYLLAVSCATAETCTAVGSFTTTAYTDRTWAAKWNGGDWISQAPTNPPGATVSALLGVACISAVRCAAVGYGEDSSGRSRPLAESWRGSRWTIEMAAVPPGTISNLNAVDCRAANACTAVGFFHTPTGDDETLAEQWGGVNWRIQTTPDRASSMDSYLNAVSCPRNVCSSVGSAGVLLKRESTLAEVRTDGKWTIQPTENP